MSQFNQLGLSQSLCKVLEQLGFEQPTPIQQKAIPLLLEHTPTDFIGLAQTGTGKTAAFGLPLIDLIDEQNSNTQVLIMAPTRELGQQTAQQLVSFAQSKKGLRVEVVYGGADINRQIKALKSPTQIVVATPGRLLDLIRRKAIDLTGVHHVVLDEADEMLNMGFKEDIDTILSYTQNQRATWLFSATMPKEIRKLVDTYMHKPLEVTVDAAQKSNKDISHQYVVTKTANKLPAIKRFLDIQPDMRGIMFCRTKMDTQEIADELSKLGYAVEALHGDLSQRQRDAVMKRFKTRSMQLLIATDVAARGIDVNDLTHVFHHKLPDQLESYTHRSGRTGRAGKKGISMAFINPREGRKITELEKKINVQFEKIVVPTLDELKVSRINNWASLILNTKVDKQSESILKSLHGQFSGLSKEDLLKRLITTQLDHLMVPEDEEHDLNETDGRKKPATADSNGANRYYINVGTIDGVTNADLIHFLADVSGIRRKHFKDLRIQKNCSFFDLEAKYDKGFEESFAFVEVDGRPIRVNRDDENRVVKKKKQHRKGKDRSGRPNRGRPSVNPASRRGRGRRR